MQTDHYQPLRDALAMGPTPGPWRCEHETGGGHDCWMIYAGNWPKSGGIVGYYTHTGPRHIPHVRPNIEAVAIAHHIAACDPDTIHALLSERDALRAAVKRVVEIADSDPFQTVGFTVEHVVDLRAALADGEAAPAGVDVKWACTRSEFT